MRYILCPFGTHGDVIPFIRTGQIIQSNGHRVSVVTLDIYQDLVESSGLEFFSFCDSQLFDEGVRDPDLWHPVKGFPVLMRKIAMPAVRPMFHMVHRLVAEEPCELIIGSLSMGARIAAEKNSLNVTTLCLQPAVLRSVELMPKYSGVPSIMNQNRCFSRLVYWVIDTFVNALCRKDINQFRLEQGLEPVSDILKWWLADHRLIALFPRWYAPHASDWSSRLIQSEFPLDNRLADPANLPQPLCRFLNAGPPPVLFTFGTGMFGWHRFLETIHSACRNLDIRYIIAAPEDLPENASYDRGYFLRYADFQDLMPQCRMVVHHGGIGTTAEALRAGIPQLIVPQSFDQPDNASRVKKLGTGDYLTPGNFIPDRLIAAIRHLVNSPHVAQRCRSIAGFFEESDFPNSVWNALNNQ